MIVASHLLTVDSVDSAERSSALRPKDWKVGFYLWAFTLFKNNFVHQTIANSSKQGKKIF